METTGIAEGMELEALRDPTPSGLGVDGAAGAGGLGAPGEQRPAPRVGEDERTAVVGGSGPEPT